MIIVSNCKISCNIVWIQKKDIAEGWSNDTWLKLMAKMIRRITYVSFIKEMARQQKERSERERQRAEQVCNSLLKFYDQTHPPWFYILCNTISFVATNLSRRGGRRRKRRTLWSRFSSESIEIHFISETLRKICHFDILGPHCFGGRFSTT